ncbi:MAG: right-handed parallel beta-helix repeat-containing protein, partial [Psychrobium sp.]
GTTDVATIANKIYDLADYPYALSTDFSRFLIAEGGTPSTTNLITSTITENTTWSATDILLAQPVNISNGATLTLSAGARVEGIANSKLIINDGAKLIIAGTELSPVTLTGQGGTVGSWQGILVNGARADTNDIQISHANIEFAKNALQLSDGAKAFLSYVTLHSNTNGVVLGHDSEVDIIHSTLRDNASGVYARSHRFIVSIDQSAIFHNNSGIYLDGSWAYKVNHPTLNITNNSIYDNTNYNFYTKNYRDVDKTTVNLQNNWWGTTDVATIANKIYDLADYPYALPADYRYYLNAQNGNATQGTQLLGNINGEIRWATNNALVLADTHITDGSHLIIEAGSHLEFAKNSQLVVNKNARLSIMGSQNFPVTLTSSQQTPLPGDWKGILINAENGPVLITNTIIENADKGIYISGKKTTATVTESSITNNNYGIYVNGGNSVLVDHPNPTITNNEISNNVQSNYYTQSFRDGANRKLNARGNYWGSTDELTITQMIYDNADASSLPIVDYAFSKNSPISKVTANAGENLIGFGTVETLLNGSGNSDAGIASYKWQQYLGNPIPLINANKAVASFTMPDVQNEQFMSFALTVTDNNNISATDNLNVVIKPFTQFNKAPIVAEAQEQILTGGDIVSVTLA